MNAQTKNKATETSNYAQELSNIVAQQSNTKRILRAVMPPALNFATDLFMLALEIVLWIMLPVTAFVFVGFLSPMFGSGTHGELVTIAAFAVAAVAGIRGAIQASALIRSFRVKW